MQGAFNDVAMQVERNANIPNIKAQIDLILSPYGGLIAYDRSKQLSNFFVENELLQLESMGMIAPIIFLFVAAFLVNVVMSRQIATQREQIGMLKAIGYLNRELLSHYLKMVLLVVAFASVLGISLGAWMGLGMTRMYANFFHFPIFSYSFSFEVMVISVANCAIAAIAGILFALRKITI